jgi:hypothetical protein
MLKQLWRSQHRQRLRILLHMLFGLISILLLVTTPYLSLLPSLEHICVRSLPFPLLPHLFFIPICIVFNLSY